MEIDPFEKGMWIEITLFSNVDKNYVFLTECISFVAYMHTSQFTFTIFR